MKFFLRFFFIYGLIMNYEYFISFGNFFYFFCYYCEYIINFLNFLSIMISKKRYLMIYIFFFVNIGLYESILYIINIRYFYILIG